MKRKSNRDVVNPNPPDPKRKPRTAHKTANITPKAQLPDDEVMIAAYRPDTAQTHAGEHIATMQRAQIVSAKRDAFIDAVADLAVKVLEDERTQTPRAVLDAAPRPTPDKSLKRKKPHRKPKTKKK